MLLQTLTRLMQLGFLHFEVANGAAWHSFLTEVLGLADVGDGRYRMDDHAWRFQITEGPADDLVALGWEVDDVDALRERMRHAGYRDSTVPNNHPHRRRVYFYDPDGNDWEFVQYLSSDPAERNDYGAPDR